MGNVCGGVVFAGDEPVLISSLRWDWCDVNTTCLVQFLTGRLCWTSYLFYCSPCLLSARTRRGEIGTENDVP